MRDMNCPKWQGGRWKLKQQEILHPNISTLSDRDIAISLPKLQKKELPFFVYIFKNKEQIFQSSNQEVFKLICTRKMCKRTFSEVNLLKRLFFAQTIADILCIAFARKEIASAETSVFPNTNSINGGGERFFSSLTRCASVRRICIHTLEHELENQ